MERWTNRHVLLVLFMVITGAINTLLSKWADRTHAVGKTGYEAHKFDHPFFQGVAMFLGEFLCLIAFNVQRICQNRQGIEVDAGGQEFNRFIFLPAAMFDMLATSLMYVGLTMTIASSFQMLRGVADVIFHTRKLDINAVITGDLLIVMAQIIVSVQMVYEERFIKKYNISPLQAVGWKGTFGFIVLGLLLVPFYFIPMKSARNPESRLSDAIDAFQQMKNSWQICVATVGSVASIALFNFCGMSLTKEKSAMTRMVLDIIRIACVWVISASLKWQPVTYPQITMQIAGFIFINFGICLYTDFLVLPFMRFCVRLKNKFQTQNNHIVNVEGNQVDENSALIASNHC
ncbi:hypothetical protein ScPMuIL_008583 [Solemya velum]